MDFFDADDELPPDFFLLLGGFGVACAFCRTTEIGMFAKGDTDLYSDLEMFSWSNEGFTSSGGGVGLLKVGILNPFRNTLL